MTREPVRRVLVIKLGGFGDFVLAFGAFNAIRRHHADAHIILLTTKPYFELAQKSGWFDEVWKDGAPAWGRFGKVARLIGRMRRTSLDRVYDLDNTQRTGRYRFWMRDFWGNKTEWSYSSRGFLPFLRASKNIPEHYVEQLVHQLTDSGITDMPTPDLSWLTAGYGGRYGLQDGFVLIAPGGSFARQGRGWPIEKFSELARRLAIEGRRPVIIGQAVDAANNQVIAAASPEAMDLTGKTSLFDVAVLATHASAALGNDSGIVRLLAAAGCPTAVMLSGASDPDRNAPRGRYVVMLREEKLADLQVSEVAAALRLR